MQESRIFMNINTKFQMHSRKQLIIILLALSTVLNNAIASEYEVGSRILVTSGASTVEGSAGGGIVPWAILSGYGQSGEWGGDVYGTYIKTDDFEITSVGISIAHNNRIEISLTNQILGIDAIAPSLGLPDNEVTQTIAGVKLKAFGDLIYGKLPQVSIGMQYKKNTDFDVPAITGALDDDGIDFYVSATKLWLHGLNGYPLLLNTTLRSTKANQLGLLGFGGDLDNGRSILFEGSAGLLIRRDLLLGIEYRQKPNNLSFAKEDDWKDIFLAWFPNKHLSLTGAYVDLGDIAGKTDQNGYYLSLEGTF
jgi:Protein of unknown function (DUF3034)